MFPHTRFAVRKARVRSAVQRLATLGMALGLLVAPLSIAAQGGPVITAENFEHLTVTATFQVGEVADLAVTDAYLAVGSLGGVTVYSMDDLTLEIRGYYTETTAVSLDAARDRIALVSGGAITLAPTTAFYAEPASWEKRLRGHEARETALVFTSSGELYSADASGLVIHWGSEGEVLARVQLSETAITTLALAGDSVLLAGDNAGVVWQWGADGVRELLTLDAGISDLARSAQGVLAVATETGQVGVVQGGTFEPLPIEGTHIAWSPDGTRLAIGDAGGQLILWDVVASTPSATYAAQHAQPITVVRWHGERVISAGMDGRVVLHDLASGSVEELRPFPCCIEAAGHNAETIVFARSDLTLWRFDMATETLDLLLREIHASAVAISADGRYVAAVDGLRAELVVLEGGDVTRYKLEINETYTSASAMAFSSDGHVLYMALSGGEVLAFSVPDFAPLWLTDIGPNDLPAHGLAVLPDGTQLAVGSRLGDVYFLDTHDGAVLRQQHAASYAIDSLAYTHDGRRLALGSRSVGYEWVAFGTKEGALHLCPQSGKHSSAMMAYSADESLVLCANTVLEGWVVETGRTGPVPIPEAYNNDTIALVPAPDGTRLYVVSRHEIQRWEVVE